MERTIIKKKNDDLAVLEEEAPQLTETGEVRLENSKSSSISDDFEKWVSRASEIRRSAELIIAEKEKTMKPSENNSSAETLKSGTGVTGHFGPNEDVQVPAAPQEENQIPVEPAVRDFIEDQDDLDAFEDGDAPKLDFYANEQKTATINIAKPTSPLIRLDPSSQKLQPIMMPNKHLRNPTAMTAPNRSIDFSYFEQLKMEKNNQMEAIAEKTSNATNTVELLQFLRSRTGHVPNVGTSKDVWINT